MGTSCPSQPRRCKVWDHPHAYGDKHIGIFEQGACQGSSPRVWGQAPTVTARNTQLRIIPTRMGTSTAVVKAYPITWDHPHAYGDKDKVKKAGFTNAGSSPRVWGQVYRESPSFGVQRIIPTRMGTSFILLCYTYLVEDHPHAYGDKIPRNCLR